MSRRHHNNTGKHHTGLGKTYTDIARIAKKLGISVGTAQQGTSDSHPNWETRGAKIIAKRHDPLEGYKKPEP